MLEYLVAATEHRSIVVHLSPCPKLQMPHLRLVIRILSDEIHAFLKEIFFLKLWPLREWLALNWLDIVLRNRGETKIAVSGLSTMNALSWAGAFSSAFSSG